MINIAVEGEAIRLKRTLTCVPLVCPLLWHSDHPLTRLYSTTWRASGCWEPSLIRRELPRISREKRRFPATGALSSVICRDSPIDAQAAFVLLCAYTGKEVVG